MGLATTKSPCEMPESVEPEEAPRQGHELYAVPPANEVKPLVQGTSSEVQIAHNP